MANETPIPQSLKAIIHRVADQYQCATIMRCWIRFGCFTLIFIVLGMIAMKLVQPIPLARIWPISIFVLMECIAFGYTVIRPLRRPITRGQIALYMEEKHPELENRLLSAVDFDAGHPRGTSPWMLEQFFQDTDQIVKRVSFADLLDLNLLTRLLVLSVSLLTFSGLIVVAFHSLWFPDLGLFHERPVVSQPVYEFSVEPGNARVRIGDHQTILCKTSNDKMPITLVWRSSGQAWNSDSMQASVTPGVYFHTFPDMQNDIEYAVQLGEARSDSFLLKTWMPPKLEAIDVVYHYPDYLNRLPQEIPNAGSLTCIEGTRIEITAHINKKIHSANLVFDSSQTIPMEESSDTTWKGSWVLETGGRFSIPLIDEDGEASELNPSYEITLQPDRPPSITLIFPRQDLEASLLDEIPIEFSLSDDFGVGEYGIRYEIAGRDPIVIPLQASVVISTTTTNLLETHVASLLRLEELNLEEGDLITWAAWAKDRKPNRDEYETLSDPFFIEIRPFRRMYEDAISNAGANSPESNNQNGENQPALNQKQIIIATWNLRRGALRLNEEEFNSKRDDIAEAQKKLLDNALNPERPASGNASLLSQLTEAMRKAIEGLNSAQLPDPETHLSEAMLQEQKAYRLLLKMRPDRTQIQQQLAQNSRGGMNENSPDIGELETERKRNFYEEERRVQQQLEKTDEALNRINDLAHRQKSINEELSKLISEARSETPSQEMKRQLEKLQEEERRNLERLDEMESHLAMSDRRDSRTDQALRQLNDIREHMNRGLEQMQNNQLQESRVSGTRAVNSLDRMQEEVQQFSREGASQRMADLQKKMQELITQEQSIQDRLDQLKQEQESPSFRLDPQLEEKKTSLQETKSRLAEDFVNTMTMANELSERAKRSQGLLSRQLGDWMRETSGRGIYEDIQSEQKMPLIRYGIWGTALEREQQIMDKLQQSSNRLQEVADSLISNDLEGMQLALEQMRKLMQSDASTETVASGSPLVNDAVNGATALEMGETPDYSQGNETTGIRSPEETEREGNDQGGDPRENHSEGNQTSENPSPSENPQGNHDRGQPQRSGAPGQAQEGNATERDTQAENARGNDGQNRDSQSGITGEAPGGARRWPLRNEIRSPESMERFADSEYREWLDSLRNAEQLLPGENPFRNSLSRIRDVIEGMRGNYTRNREAPKYDLFLDSVADPLLKTAQELDRTIQALLSQEEFVMVDEGGIPDSYRESVAEYFKKVSEIGTSRE